MNKPLLSVVVPIFLLSTCSKREALPKGTDGDGTAMGKTSRPDSPDAKTDARKPTKPAPASLPPRERIPFSSIKVAVGGNHSMILNSDSTLWLSGSNENGQLGIGDKTFSIDTFRKTLDGVCDVAAGSRHSLALKCDGSLWAAGSTYRGQFGRKQTKPSYNFQKIADDVVAVAARGYSTMVVKRDGTVWMAGNVTRAFGITKDDDRCSFTKIQDGARAASIGDDHLLVLKKDGTAWGGGDNQYDQLGLARPDQKDPKKFENHMTNLVQIASDAMAVSAGAYHSLVLKNDGTLWASGWNEYGQLGTGDHDDRHGFEKVLSRVVAVAGGNRLTFALRTDGILWATGGRGFGENRKFDDYDNKKRTLFRRDLTDVTDFATSWDSYGTFEGFSLAIRKDGTVWGYGYDGWGVFGRGVSDLSKWTELYHY